MTHAEVQEVLDGFGITPSALARSMRVSVVAMYRWQKGHSSPTGLYLEVLRALLIVARSTSRKQRRTATERLQLGVGAVLLAGLKEPVR